MTSVALLSVLFTAYARAGGKMALGLAGDHGDVVNLCQSRAPFQFRRCLSGKRPMTQWK